MTGILPAMFVRLPLLPLLLLSVLPLVVSCANTGAQPSLFVADTAASQPDVNAVGPDAANTTADVKGQLSSGPGIELVTNTAYLLRTMQIIQTANERLDIVQFESKGGEKPGTSVNLLVEAAIQAQKRGVKVRVLFDDEIADNAVVVAYLKARGVVNAKLDNAKTRTHAKIVYSEQGFVAGSTNWSTSSIDYNNETNALVRDLPARAVMGKYLDSLWKSASKPIYSSFDLKAAVGVYGDGKDDGSIGYAAVVGPLLDSAKKRIILVTYGMNVDLNDTNSPVTKTVRKLEAAVKRKIPVQALMDLTTDSSGEGNEVNAESGKILKSLGVEVRNDPGKVITHAKFLIVDDTVILGTNNWGYMGFVLDHEVGVRTSDTKVLGNLLTYFQGIWAKSSPL